MFFVFCSFKHTHTHVYRLCQGNTKAIYNNGGVCLADTPWEGHFGGSRRELLPLTRDHGKDPPLALFPTPPQGGGEGGGPPPVHTLLHKCTQSVHKSVCTIRAAICTLVCASRGALFGRLGNGQNRKVAKANANAYCDQHLVRRDMHETQARTQSSLNAFYLSHFPFLVSLCCRGAPDRLLKNVRNIFSQINS